MAEQKITLSKSQIYLLSVASAVIAANAYYAQPLLAYWANTFQVSEASAGQVFFLSMLGQALGMITLVPLGDKFRRKQLILWTMGCSAVAILMAAFSGGIGMLKICMLIGGFFSIAPQLMIPMAVDLSLPEYRTHIIGLITAGVLSGVVFARLFAGIITVWFGWRLVYGLSALLLTLSFVGIRRFIPESRPGFTGSYGSILKSGWKLFRQFPEIRVAILLGGTGFVLSRMFWATIAFLLAGPLYGLNTDLIGLVGLVTLAGAASAPLAGALGRRFTANQIITLGIGLLVVSFGLLFFFPSHLTIVLAGGLLMEGSRQLIQINMQSRTISLVAEARSRLNMLFISGCFLGAALGAALGLFAWHLDKWNGVCYAAFLILAIQITVFMATRKRT